MSITRPTFPFSEHSDIKLIDFCNVVSGRLTGNPHYPTTNPSLTVIADAVQGFTAIVADSRNGDRELIRKREEDREALLELMYLLVYYVTYTAAGNRNIFLMSGFPLAKPNRPTAEMGDPTDLQVVNSTQSGTLLVSTKKVKGAVAYVHQYSTDPELKEENWMSMTCTSSKCILEGLIPGTTYYIRVAAIGSKEQVRYSTIVTKIAA